ncbi:MAG: hypothetical protein GC171_11630 [Terrimonas sp.]|nr:hypothetical protein [Terrimonas sp.]
MNPKTVSRILFLFLLLATHLLSAQLLLNKNLSLQVSNQRMDNVLEILSNKGDFYFSYNSKIVNKDSLVSLSAQNKSLKEILSLLFNESYEFRESGNYIIIRKAPIRMTMVTERAVNEDRIYSVSGFVYNRETGSAISEASIYEKKLLAAALSNQNGYFKIRLKSSKAAVAELNVSKEFYMDTMVRIETRHDQQLTVTLMPLENTEENVTVSPLDYLIPDLIQALNLVQQKHYPLPVDTGTVERTGAGRFLLSSQQKIQSLNLRKFFTERPFQVSLTPGLSTHGRLSPQVVNNFSFNVLGGYTAGTHGFELGGLFNIDKKEVKYFQLAGLFNIDGGKFTGFQLAGINNTVLDSVRGFQVGGVNNLVKGKFTGFQLGGVYNHVTDSVKGFQLAGVGNFARKKVSGLQVAGVANFSNKEINGVQIAGVINYTKRLKGVQIGLINIVDSSDGYSIGLINVVLKGYHKLAVSSNEVTGFNLAFKTGNQKFYSILQAGMHTGNLNKAYAFGYGLGSEMPLNKKKNIAFNPELISQYLYLGSWNYLNLLNRAQLQLHVKINKFISVYGGPSYNVFVSDQWAGIAGYRYPVPKSGYGTHSYSNRVSGWWGWNAGINIF